MVYKSGNVLSVRKLLHMKNARVFNTMNDLFKTNLLPKHLFLSGSYCSIFTFLCGVMLLFFSLSFFVICTSLFISMTCDFWLSLTIFLLKTESCWVLIFSSFLLQAGQKFIIIVTFLRYHCTYSFSWSVLQ